MPFPLDKPASVYYNENNKFVITNIKVAQRANELICGRNGADILTTSLDERKEEKSKERKIHFL